MVNQRSILLHSSDGAQTQIYKSPDVEENNEINNSGVQFDSAQIENDRGRSKRRNGEFRNGSGASLSRSRSRANSRVRDEEFLKWTVLRRDPSMRLRTIRKKNQQGLNKKKHGAEEDDDEEEDEEEEEEEEDDDDDEISDEEQVSDIENENDIDEDITFDLGTKVLPNYCMSINDIMESSKKWISDYLSRPENLRNDNVHIEKMEGGFVKAMELISKKEDSSTSISSSGKEGDSYILYTDLTSESTYALAYVLGALVNNGDTLYVVHWEGNNTHGVTDTRIYDNIFRIRKHVMHLLDCSSAVIDRIDILLISLTHPYPKHLLNEMIHGLKPKTLCCSLSVVLSPSGLQNYVSSIPMLVIRKKLKRPRKKGINE
ncbi:hypothetical protein Kpol_1043p76 [Vanderwaltozyma polyspora DSM 70294]|uniref:Sugar utilization regulatory protein IMP2 n=1 Tax=Vanderwaltozyma polyspora (strain ATCC 22028 / DSM 70294 / BCRC 21397 / CBS 2163 / NBRC 10782 / NRRL Y-8283 / UCD 57-17) TaxID=436907 RepID=A7TIU3_VANPO|nr:uncharacterized protein Kpol_1043p76 [Vanderwaltozyma polyspora DSM 70294]EDO17885.1 hypothetical protein Kpol_1043p76 [Vanderwaltozyma polyspora DSM 70294]